MAVTSTSVAPPYHPLIDLLVSNGIIDQQQAEELRDEQKNSGKPFRTLLVDAGYVSEDDLLGMMAAYQGCDVIDLEMMSLDTEVIQSIPASVARMYNVLPVSATAGTITLATSDLVDPHVTDELMFVLTRDVQFVMARENDVRTRVAEYYGDESATVADMLNSLESDLKLDTSLDVDDTDDKSLESAASAAPVIRFVNLVLYQAVTDRASDIHFEPFETDFKIRYRVDGALYEMSPPPRRLALPIISRIKVMSGLNIAERRVPQDGRIALTVAGRSVDLRVSCLPTAHGESVVLRVLDRSVVSLDLENVGLPEDVYEELTLDIEKPNGIIIVTGPTGSGKTTTLYSCLRRINTIDQKLLTAEEPVEYDMDGIVQVQINPSAGNTFPRVLRAFLRQDPDIMMIGEIRDLETAEIAVQASLTGHLVFSTLHTNDAAGAVTRLIDMNVAPYLIASTLEAVLGQRLVRTICLNCKEPYTPDDETLSRMDLKRAAVGDRPFYYGRGCSKCNGTGYKGRKGVFEYLRVSDPIRELINERRPTLFIRERARELGMRTMREDAIRNVLDGYTTVDEVLRYT
ncbi:MAG TPA: ATPase, T2SS/T4P/T4SS family [Kiritimatiellia bacterium]|nr:ATPase, T2SS/T4P/T4SS family [Kiritimatiellia bacterium]HOM59545.1 ATPase, T2SS/T4P/T4SS family [Kiritimatiellia bacterium]HOR98142.1 ATPase, T2SS/T4P/T4SS family [Kiritimatiellia bacterium]HPC49135.1 ATPase, T2SS/T4P/T4SS family [Kiritimatiellia bacterium]HPK37009.1 ATPase, T2SS/T4P/T4SS family [Kiritimatiellia bacterium]